MENYRIERLEKKYIEDVFLLEKTFFGLENSSVIESSLSSETLDYYVLLDREKVVGFYECSVVLDEAELFDIAVKEEYQGKKLSNVLMNHLIENCRHRQVRTIFLEVNINNIKAINLYAKFGFKEYSRRKNYYGDSDAVLMKLELV